MASRISTLSVVICLPSRPAISPRLAAVIDSLRAQRLAAGDSLSLILAFNGPCPPPSAPAIGGAVAEIQVLHVPLRGKSRAANLALAHTHTDIILWGDDDVVYHPDWAASLTSALRRHPDAAVTGVLEIAPELLRPWMQPCHLARFACSLPDDQPPTALIGCTMGIRRRAGVVVPEFDTDLGPGSDCGSAEDVLYSLMLQAHGLRLLRVPEARAVHHFSADRLSATAITRMCRADGRSLAYIDYHWFHRSLLDSPRLVLAIFGGSIKHHLGAGPARLFSRYTTGSWKFNFWTAYYLEMRALRGQPRRYASDRRTTADSSAGQPFSRRDSERLTA